MKAIIFTLSLCLLIFTQVEAQNSSKYSELIRLAKQINNFQSEANGRIMLFQDTYSIAKYKLTFPPENFVVSPVDGKLSVYYNVEDVYNEQVKASSKIDNIDLSKVNSVFFLDMLGSGAGLIRCISDEALTRKRLNGNSYEAASNTTSFNVHAPYGKGGTGTMLLQVADLIYRAKLDKKLITADQIEKEKVFWKETTGLGTNEAYKAYADKYPKSILTQYAAFVANGGSALSLWNANKPALDTGEFHLGMDRKEVKAIMEQKLYRYQTEDKFVQSVLGNYQKYYGNADKYIFSMPNGFLYNELMFEGEGNLQKAVTESFKLYSKKYYKYRPEVFGIEYAMAKVDNDLSELMPEAILSMVGKIIFNENNKVSELEFYFTFDFGFSNYEVIMNRFLEKYGNPDVFKKIEISNEWDKGCVMKYLYDQIKGIYRLELRMGRSIKDSKDVSNRYVVTATLSLPDDTYDDGW